jgi:cytochrome b
MNKLSKHLISLAIISLLVLPFIALKPVLAQSNDQFGLNYVNNGLNNSLTNSDPRTVIGRIINITLSFLGVIAVAIILLGGFKWMTAGGNEEKTGEAKKLLGAGVIGLVIILASWGIATYLLSTFANTIGGNS